MIKAVLFFALFAVALAEVHWPPHGYDECKASTGATDAEATMFTNNKIPHTDVAACFYGCVWKKMHLLKDDNTIDPAVFIKYIKYILEHGSAKYTPDITMKALALYSTCTLEVNEHPVTTHDKAECDVVKKFAHCAEEVQKEHHFGEHTKH